MGHANDMVGTGHGRILTGLVGRGILRSRSPWLHEQEGDAQGLRLAYSLIDFTDRGWDDARLADVLQAAQLLGFAGLNITFPFKQAVIPLLDELSDGARAIGAVNTVAFQDGKRIGYNTDVTGFATSFKAGLPDVACLRVLQLGCGGAGSATAQALLADIGAEHLVLFDTDPARAEALAAQLAAQHGAGRVSTTSDAAGASASADGIINATPIGMAKFPGLPIAAEAIRASHWAAEIVYFPLETAFLAEARAKGCRTVDGMGMAVKQAADAFGIFTGLPADSARMMASFAKFDTVPA